MEERGSVESISPSIWTVVDTVEMEPCETDLAVGLISEAIDCVNEARSPKCTLPHFKHRRRYNLIPKSIDTSATFRKLNP
ncbi:hypothetical protein F4779DRAFT_607853 [Xylariaceae sp. FL0662B]|nr:hypothetical protein F4779DRAFT_607853 [Xylariaceae sp. FL0662B]